MKPKENKNGKDGKRMDLGFIGKIADMVKSIADLSKTVVESSDPEKYARGVEKLNQGVSDSYEQMRLIIVNSDKFSDEEKLERLQTLAEREQVSKMACDEAIKGNREHISKITMEVVKGLLTCGLTFIPEIAKRLKIVLDDDLPALESGQDSPLLAEATTVPADKE